MNKRLIRTVFLVFVLAFTLRGEDTHDVIEAIEVIEHAQRHHHSHLHHKTKGGKH